MTIPSGHDATSSALNAGLSVNELKAEMPTEIATVRASLDPHSCGDPGDEGDRHEHRHQHRRRRNDRPRHFRHRLLGGGERRQPRFELTLDALARRRSRRRRPGRSPAPCRAGSACSARRRRFPSPPSVVMSDTGIAIIATIVARELCRKMKTTKTTERQAPRASVTTTSCIAAVGSELVGIAGFVEPKHSQLDMRSCSIGRPRGDKLTEAGKLS